MTRVPGLLWTIALLTLAFAHVPLATAHSAAVYVPIEWPDGAPTNVTWFFTEEVTNQNRRDDIRFGFNQWDFAGGADFKYTSGTPDQENYNADTRWDCDPLPGNSIHWEPLDLGSGILGAAVVCPDANQEIQSFQVAFESSYNWNLTGGDPGDNEYDLRSVATHEAGHAGGFGHFYGSFLCPGDNTDHTMCGTGLSKGTKYKRSLEEHDRDTFANAYT